MRAIVGSENTTRIEQRDASADCNVYLTFAGQFGSGLDGMHRNLVLGEPVAGNAHDRNGDEQLPKTFIEAMAVFEQSVFAAELLGPIANTFQGGL